MQIVDCYVQIPQSLNEKQNFKCFQVAQLIFQFYYWNKFYCISTNVIRISQLIPQMYTQKFKLIDVIDM